MSKQEYGFVLNTEYAVRLKSMENGGWKGNSAYLGTLSFTRGPINAPTKMFTTIPFLVKHFGHDIVIESIQHLPRREDNGRFYLMLTMDVGLKGLPDNIGGRVVFEIHRDSVMDLVPIRAVDAGTQEVEETMDAWDKVVDEKVSPNLPMHPNAAGGVTDFAYEEGKRAAKAAGVLHEFHARDVPYKGTDAEREFISMLEKYVFFTDDPKRQLTELTPGFQARSVAIAMIRYAVRSPATHIYFYPMPAWMPSPQGIRSQLEGFLTATGLGRFARFGYGFFFLRKPDDKDPKKVYDYARAIEPWLAPIDEFRLRAVPAELMEKAQDNDAPAGLKEALDLSKKLEATQAPAQPAPASGVTPLNVSSLE